MNYDFVTRYAGNPVIKPSDLAHLPGGCNSVFNSAVTRFGAGYKAILRVEKPTGFTSLLVADSEDGRHFDVHPDPILLPENEEQALYEEAVYDARITQIDDTYYVCYAAESVYGCAVALASTQDFKTFTRYGCIAEPINRNLVLFPEKINGKYFRLDRPFQSDFVHTGSIWLMESPDLIHWGRPKCVMESRRFAWDKAKIGAGAPPIKTDEGWLCVYHGTSPLCNSLTYRLGVAILDLEQPWIVKHRAQAYILGPAEEYERIGDCPNVCFINSAIPYFEEDRLDLYYGGADTVMCLASCKISELIQFAKEC